jgi:DNA-binding NarL/FixJ family response regulator
VRLHPGNGRRLGFSSRTSFRNQRGTPAPFALTENRRDILVRLFAGERVGEIAARTGRSESTVQNTLRTVRKQLRARTHVDLMRESLRLGIVTLEEIVARAAAVRP